MELPAIHKQTFFFFFLIQILTEMFWEGLSKFLTRGSRTSQPPTPALRSLPLSSELDFGSSFSPCILFVFVHNFSSMNSFSNKEWTFMHKLQWVEMCTEPTWNLWFNSLLRHWPGRDICLLYVVKNLKETRGGI